MVEFEREEYSIDGSTYVVTKGNITGTDAVIAVTNIDEGVHYISEEYDAASDEALPTETIPSGNGMPDIIRHGVSIHKMSDINAAISVRDERDIRKSLTELGEEFLVSQTTNNNDRDDTETANRKFNMYEHNTRPSDYL